MLLGNERVKIIALFAGVYAQCASTAGSLALVSGRIDDEDFMARQTDALFLMCVEKGIEAVNGLEKATK